MKKKLRCPAGLDERWAVPKQGVRGGNSSEGASFVGFNPAAGRHGNASTARAFSPWGQMKKGREKTEKKIQRRDF